VLLSVCACVCANAGAQIGVCVRVLVYECRYEHSLQLAK
jgi:hypothetical protein